MASANKSVNDRFKEMRVNDLVSQVNRLVVEHAEKLVFGSADAQLRFVSPEKPGKLSRLASTFRSRNNQPIS